MEALKSFKTYTRDGGSALEKPYEKPVIVPQDEDLDPARHACADARFATDIMAEHARDRHHRTQNLDREDAMETEFVTVAKTGDIGAGEVAVFEAKGTTVAVANVAGTFYAFDDVCTHRQCSLSQGELDGTAISCPCHGSRFDVTTGAVLNPPAKDPVNTYSIRVHDDNITVQV